MSNQRILIVEDEPLIRDVLVAGLSGAGFIVVAAANAVDAFEAARGIRFDLLFVDIRMPGAFDGWRIAERMRDAHPNLPVVYASGEASLGAGLMPNGCILRKPFRIAEALSAVRALLDEGAVARRAPTRLNGWAA